MFRFRGLHLPKLSKCSRHSSQKLFAMDLGYNIPVRLIPIKEPNMIVTTKKLFEAAYGKYAIGAYNINNLEQTMGLFRGNLDSQAPFIIQISKGARAYTHKDMLEGLIRSAEEVFPQAIFAVHLDHGDEATCYDCIESGFYSSGMIDASHENFENRT